MSREKDSKSSRGGAGSTSKEKGSRSKKISSTEEDKAGKKSNKPSAEPVEPVVPSLIQESDSALPKYHIQFWLLLFPQKNAHFNEPHPLKMYFIALYFALYNVFPL